MTEKRQINRTPRHSSAAALRLAPAPRRRATPVHYADWFAHSPESEGLHKVFAPRRGPCRLAQFWRLNVPGDGWFRLQEDELELSLLFVEGQSTLAFAEASFTAEKYDGLYLGRGAAVEIESTADTVVYIGAAAADRTCPSYFRKYDPYLPLGDVRQIHGNGIYSRDVYMLVGPHDDASRLMTGITWSRPGGWTSWPPHHHGHHQEEISAYFDLPPGVFGMQLSYMTPSEQPYCHTVHNGDAVAAPKGYHPTVAIPDSRTVCFWVLAALDESSRQYDLGEPDPRFAPTAL